MNETIPIKTDDNHLYCDACGYEIHQEDEICEHCKREIDWNKQSQYGHYPAFNKTNYYNKMPK